MGTHPIFESDFDCLTEMNVSAEYVSTDCEYVSYSAQKEIEAILSWYRNWREEERSEFVRTVSTLIQPQIDHILQVFDNIKIEKTWSAPNIFSCQMKLLRDWWRVWAGEEKKFFQLQLSANLTGSDLAELKKILNMLATLHYFRTLRIFFFAPQCRQKISLLVVTFCRFFVNFSKNFSGYSKFFEIFFRCLCRICRALHFSRLNKVN